MKSLSLQVQFYKWKRLGSEYKWPAPVNGSVVERWGLPGGSDGKESACSVGDLCSIPGLGRYPGEGIGYPRQYSGLQNPHGQRSLVGYSPLGLQRVRHDWATNTHPHFKDGAGLKPCLLKSNSQLFFRSPHTVPHCLVDKCQSRTCSLWSGWVTPSLSHPPSLRPLLSLGSEINLKTNKMTSSLLSASLRNSFLTWTIDSQLIWKVVSSLSLRVFKKILEDYLAKMW